MSDATRFVVNAEAAVYWDGAYLLVERAATEDHAAGALSLVGGTVEGDGAGDDVLVATVRREVREEVGVDLDEVVYVASSRFVDDGGTPVVNAVFLARHAGGTPTVREPAEVASVDWYAPEALQSHDAVPPFTREYVAAADRRRRARGW